MNKRQTKKMFKRQGYVFVKTKRYYPYMQIEWREDLIKDVEFEWKGKARFAKFDSNGRLPH